jgi:hypothetical protein
MALTAGCSTESELRKRLSAYAAHGPIAAVRIDTLANFGYVQFVDAADARDAQRAMKAAGTECFLASTGATKRY